MAKKNYDDNSLKQLKGPDQVRLRPGVIFGSDGLDGCCHSVFEILSNSIDEAREGFGKKIIVTRFLDKSIEVQDYGRGIPIDFNKNEERSCFVRTAVPGTRMQRAFAAVAERRSR